MKILKFVLSAPLQSWGEDNKWDNRLTALMPTKSGIIGLLGCCLGYLREDIRLNVLDEQLHLAVRVEQPGTLMTDYHTVGGTDGVILNAMGKNRGSTIITPRQYLQGAVFTIFLWGDESLLKQCFQALLHPHWAPYLGRKSCIPSRPILPEWVNCKTIDQAVRFFDKDMPLPQFPAAVEIELLPGEILQPNERMREHNDKIIHSIYNEYAGRRVRAFSIHKEEICT